MAFVVDSSPLIFILKGKIKYSLIFIPTQCVEMQPTNPKISGFSIDIFNAESPPILAPIMPRLSLLSLILNFVSIAGITLFITKS